VDYKKAFDRIQHEKLIHILQDIGLDSHNITIIRNLLKSPGMQQMAIHLIDLDTLGDCLLSSLLFNVYEEYIVK